MITAAFSISNQLNNNNKQEIYKYIMVILFYKNLVKRRLYTRDELRNILKNIVLRIVKGDIILHFHWKL